MTGIVTELPNCLNFCTLGMSSGNEKWSVPFSSTKAYPIKPCRRPHSFGVIVRTNLSFIGEYFPFILVPAQEVPLIGSYIRFRSRPEPPVASRVLAIGFSISGAFTMRYPKPYPLLCCVTICFSNVSRYPDERKKRESTFLSSTSLRLSKTGVLDLFTGASFGRRFMCCPK